MSKEEPIIVRLNGSSVVVCSSVASPVAFREPPKLWCTKWGGERKRLRECAQDGFSLIENEQQDGRRSPLNLPNSGLPGRCVTVFMWGLIVIVTLHVVNLAGRTWARHKPPMMEQLHVTMSTTLRQCDFRAYSVQGITYHTRLTRSIC